jgi:hypothetical protein
MKEEQTKETCANTETLTTIEELIDSYFKNRIDGTLFALLVILQHIRNKVPMSVFKNHATVALECLQTKNHLSPKQEQERKRLLCEIVDAFNHGDKDSLDRVYDTLEDTMLKIIEAVNQAA